MQRLLPDILKSKTYLVIVAGFLIIASFVVVPWFNRLEASHGAYTSSDGVGQVDGPGNFVATQGGKHNTATNNKGFEFPHYLETVGRGNVNWDDLA